MNFLDLPRPILNVMVQEQHRADYTVLSNLLDEMYEYYDEKEGSMILLEEIELKILSLDHLYQYPISRFNKRFIRGVINRKFKEWESEYRKKHFLLGRKDYKVCTIIGRSTLVEEKLKAAAHYEKEGYIVLGARMFKGTDPITYLNTEREGDLSDDEVNHLREKYKYMISLSDCVILVIGSDGYIGKNTIEEKEYAEMLGIPVIEYR